jgi:hypothetical protein
MQSPIEEGAVSTMEPDEGAQPDDPQADAPRRDREEEADAADAPALARADTDAESSDTDGSDAYDVSSGDVGRDQATDSDS